MFRGGVFFVVIVAGLLVGIAAEAATISGAIKLDYGNNERGSVHFVPNAAYPQCRLHVRIRDKSEGGALQTVIAANDGTFTASVSAGTFVVTADADTGNPATTGYGPGLAVDNVVVLTGAVVSNIEPGVAPLNIRQAKSVSPGVPMCVKGICDAERQIAELGITGFPTQYFLRDSSLSDGGYDGIAVTDDHNPMEMTTVVVEARISHSTGGGLEVSSVAANSFYILNDSTSPDYGPPTPCLVTDFNGNVLGGVDPGWGRLYKVSDVTCTAVDIVNKRFRVTDSGHQTGLVVVSETTGIVMDESFAAQILNAKLSVIGVKDRVGAYQENCLRPRKPSDIMGLASPCQPISTGTGGFVRFGRWNLVSVPGEPINPDPLSVFAGIDVANASFQFWKNCGEPGGYQLYGEPFGWTGPIQRGVPYWFLETGAGGDKDLTVSINCPPPTEIGYDIVVCARSGAPFWIIFGLPYASSVPAADVTDPNTGVTTPGIRFRNVARRGDVWLTWQEAYSAGDSRLRIVDSNAQGWNASAGGYASVAPPEWIAERDHFDPWWGYWMLITDPNELRIRFPKL